LVSRGSDKRSSAMSPVSSQGKKIDVKAVVEK
jgi:hypothetical protein